MKISGSIEKVPVLVIIGDLKRKGLDSKLISLGIMDGLSGLERVL